jgi:hypothetical protein
MKAGFYFCIILFSCALQRLVFAESSLTRVKTGARLLETQFIFDKTTTAISNPPGWNLRDGFPVDMPTDNRFMKRNTNSLLYAGVVYERKTEDLKVILDFDLVKRSESSRDMIYAGKNSYISLSLGQFWLGVGRRNFIFRESPFSGYSDGGDGLFIESDFQKKWKFQFFLWDHYRGYRLLEKEYLSPSLLSGQEIEAHSGQRRRHSFGLVYEDSFRFSFGISYFEMGTFGKQTKEVNSNVTKYGADGDAVILGNLGGKKNLGNFYTSLEFLWAKGVDKTANKATTTSGSFLIEGEAITLGAGYSDNFIRFGIATQIHDSEERNDKNQIVKLGYLNTGTHLGSTYYLSQYLQMYPSGHFTESGLERNQTLLRGRSQGSYGEIFFGVQFYEIFFKLSSALILPYRASGPSDGKISLKRENYENFYLSEYSLELAYKKDQNQIGILISHLESTSNLSIRGTMVSCYGNVVF